MDDKKPIIHFEGKDIPASERLEKRSNKIRLSKDLPDDVGSVFITDVPSFWCQLLGRRAYGELWVGYAVGASSGTDVPAWVEIVRGPEAEALLKLWDELYGESAYQDALRKGMEPAIVRPEKMTRQ